MLPAANRLRRSADFTDTVRDGVRARRRTLIVHHLPASTSTSDGPRVGFVVSKAVGNSVVRHRVSRRLRACVAPHLVRLPLGSRTVVRALPPAAGSTSSDLARDIERAIERIAPAVPA